jgi:hypothetical protein
MLLRGKARSDRRHESKLRLCTRAGARRRYERAAIRRPTMQPLVVSASTARVDGFIDVRRARSTDRSLT